MNGARSQATDTQRDLAVGDGVPDCASASADAACATPVIASMMSAVEALSTRVSRVVSPSRRTVKVWHTSFTSWIECDTNRTEMPRAETRRTVASTRSTSWGGSPTVGFVEHEDLHPDSGVERPDDRDQRAFGARQLRHEIVDVEPHVELVEQRAGSPALRAPVDQPDPVPHERASQREVLDYRSAVNQAQILMHEAHPGSGDRVA